MSEPVIEVRHLSKSFGTHVVLRDVDFTVNPGDVTCIIGASGSGKSTLLRCINLLETPTNGKVLFHGNDITAKGSDPCAYRAKVGMVFQSFNLFGNMSVLKNCVVGQVKAQLADAYHARKPIWLAELDLETLWDLHRAARIVFKALSVFPASSRDVTVIAPLTLSVAAVEKHIRDMRIAILEDVTLIDLYEPKDTEERNLTFRLTFRKADRTLKDAEVDKEREKVAQSLIKNLGVRI